MTKLQLLKAELDKYVDKEKPSALQKFFKTGPGEYGEGDVFIGVSIPNVRKVAKKFKNLSLSEIKELLYSEVHEYRLISLIVLINKFEKGDETEREEIARFYISNAKRVNNWDLVDTSAHKILGAYLLDKNKEILYKLAKSQNLWEQRISIISTLYFIKNNQYQDTINISEILLNHNHDLIHKAVGWMLREVGKKEKKVETEFLKKYYKFMPRTMLRYAIEKFDEQERQMYLKGKI